MIRILKLSAFIPALVLMYFIFGFSSEQGEESSSLSYQVTQTVVETVDRLLIMKWDEQDEVQMINKLHTPIRKIAHMSEYALLACLWYFGFVMNGIKGRNIKGYTIFLCIVYACTDEFHQLFVPGREGAVKDVIIDAIGVLLGILLVTLICNCINKLIKGCVCCKA